MKKFLLSSIAILISGLCAGVTLAAPSTDATNFSPAQIEQIQKITHDYLLQNPQLMVEIFQKLQQQQQKVMENHALTVISKNAPALFNDPNSPVAGNLNGSVILVEFFDYQCPHCKEMAPAIQSMIQQNKNLKVVFKEFPIFPNSKYAAEAALAAVNQGKYVAFHNALMADKDALNKNGVLQIAQKVGLNVQQLEKDMNSDPVKREIANTLKLAEALGLPGTPAFIIQSNTVFQQTGLKSAADMNKTFFIPGQVDANVMQNFIKKAS